jgi:hypothetical protein
MAPPWVTNGGIFQLSSASIRYLAPWPLRFGRAALFSRGAASMKKLVHWLIFAALVVHLFSCVFLGQNHVPLN